MQSSRTIRLAVVVIAVVAMMTAAVSITSSAPVSPGNPSVRTTCADASSATGTTTVNVPVTIQGLSDLGAAGYTFYMEVPSAATIPNTGSNAGPEFSAWCTGIGGTPQIGRTDITDDSTCGQPHTAGTNCWQVNVFCFTLGSLSGGVQPSLTSQLAVQAPLGSHNLTIVPVLENGSPSRVFDVNGASANMSSITNASPTVVIGGNCIPTAVTVAGLEAASGSAAPFAAATWPLLAGAAALAAGGAYTLLRRKR
jgi:hypothetical protein